MRLNRDAGEGPTARPILLELGATRARIRASIRAGPLVDVDQRTDCAQFATDGCPHVKAPAQVGVPGRDGEAYFLPPFACESALAATIRERAELQASVRIFDALDATPELVERERELFDMVEALPPSPPVYEVCWVFASRVNSKCSREPTW